MQQMTADVVTQGGFTFAARYEAHFFSWCCKNLGHLPCFRSHIIDIVPVALALRWDIVDYYLEIAPLVFAGKTEVLEYAVSDPKCSLARIQKILEVYTTSLVQPLPRASILNFDIILNKWNSLRECAAANNRVDVFAMSLTHGPDNMTHIKYTKKTIRNAVEARSLGILSLIAAQMRAKANTKRPSLFECSVWDTAVQKAIADNALEVLDWILLQRDLISDDLFFHNRGFIYNLDRLQMFKAISFSLKNDLRMQLQEAAHAGALSIVQHLVFEKMASLDMIDGLCHRAVSRGQFSLAEFAFSRGCDLSPDGARYAAAWDVPSHLAFLDNHGIFYDRRHVLSCALRNGSVETLKYLHDQHTLPLDICIQSIEHQQIVNQAESIKWALDNGIYQDLRHLESLAIDLLRNSSPALIANTQREQILHLVQSKMCSEGMRIRVPRTVETDL